MPNIIPTNTVDLDVELGNLEIYKYHPNGIMQVSLNRLNDMLGGKVSVMEPSNPFTYLLETSCLNTAFAVQEFALLTRKLYPRLANTDDDIYLHMSDYDFLGRFSEPSYANVSFNVLMNDFSTRAYYDVATKDRILKLPRHLKVMVGNYVYLLSSAIVIRLTSTGVLDVRFENQDFNNIFPVSTNYINFNTHTVNNGEQYLSFNLELPEVDVEVTDIPVDASTVNSSFVIFNSKRSYYYTRAFYKDKAGKWTEMLVTHTNEVYDVNTPTCIIKVLQSDSKIEYSIPNVYINSGAVTSNVRLLVYTTNGYVSTNFTDYKMSDFTTEYGDVFPEVEMDIYAAPMQLVTKVVYIKNSISSGKSGLTFEQLKQAVIDNSIGDRKLPITTKQLEFYASQMNFKIIKDVDIVTNRMYKLEVEVPAPITRYPVTKLNLDIIEFKGTIQTLRHSNGVTTYGNDVTVMRQGTVFRMDNGVVTILSTIEADNLKNLTGPQLTGEVNSNTYLSLYYHYVLDNPNGKTNLRVYDITTPSASQVNFKTFNATANVGVNSVTTNLYKSPNGYTLDILTNLKKNTESITERNVKPYLVYTDVSGAVFFLASNFYTVVNNQPVYRFLIDSEYYINSSNKLGITNFKDSNGATAPIFIDLNSKLEILYVSNVIPVLFSATSMDTYITNSYLYGGTCGVTNEEVTLSFGVYLERFYAGVRISTSSTDYERHLADVPMVYKATVYDGSNAIVHSVGDAVLDASGNPVIEFQKGDVRLDSYGNPVTTPTDQLTMFLNLLMVDYKVTLSSSPDVIAYSKLIRQFIDTVTVSNAVKVQEQLLDNTEAFVVLPKTIGYCSVKTPTAEYTIPSSQKFSFTLLVSYDIFNNSIIRDNISYTVIKATDDYLHQATVLKRSELLNILYTKLNEFIVSMSIDQFTELNAEYIQLLDPNSRVTIGKLLVTDASGYNLTENIDVVFKLIE